MEAATTRTSYEDWRYAVDHRLQEVYCITIEDAGFEEAYLIKHWQANEAAPEFVAWFGDKYDLDPAAAFILPRDR